MVSACRFCLDFLGWWSGICKLNYILSSPVVLWSSVSWHQPRWSWNGDSESLRASFHVYQHIGNREKSIPLSESIKALSALALPNESQLGADGLKFLVFQSLGVPHSAACVILDFWSWGDSIKGTPFRVSLPLQLKWDQTHVSKTIGLQQWTRHSQKSPCTWDLTLLLEWKQRADICEYTSSSMRCSCILTSHPRRSNREKVLSLAAPGLLCNSNRMMAQNCFDVGKIIHSTCEMKFVWSICPWLITSSQLQTLYINKGVREEENLIFQRGGSLGDF